MHQGQRGALLQFDDGLDNRVRAFGCDPSHAAGSPGRNQDAVFDAGRLLHGPEDHAARDFGTGRHARHKMPLRIAIQGLGGQAARDKIA